MKVRAVLFDLDGTLFDRDASFRELVEHQYQSFAVALAEIPHETFVRRVVELDAHGYADKAMVYRQVARELGFSEGVAVWLTQHFEEAYHRYCKCFPEVPAALASLRTKGAKLGIITNGAVSMQERKIEQLGVEQLVDEILISEREGIAKPSQLIFERALGRLGVTAGDACYVGDHPVIDIRGAFEAGLTAVWRYTSHWPRPDVPSLEIQSLDELNQLLL